AAALPRARFMPVEGEAHPAWAGGLAAVEAANAFLHGGTPVVASEGCRFDAADRCLYADGRRLPLTPLETGVLSVLVTARGHLVTRDRLLAEVWKQPYEGSNRIDVAISALRRKLGPWAASIATVTGHGYRFDGWRTSPDA
ncbi:MAG: winged helix-turn-helix transcriptional regulator, partial [Rhodobacteraceae bacterium]|nr:winged helix-turn-helix transcriptional regulator [Paracoccaceae bacterium]